MKLSELINGATIQTLSGKTFYVKVSALGNIYLQTISELWIYDKKLCAFTYIDPEYFTDDIYLSDITLISLPAP